ncbi:MAG: outer membrane beta-barrel protein [Bacteroidales bacterium]|nr:outer membrane beta-barrel protein [Bacteroidales bacterium]
MKQTNEDQWLKALKTEVENIDDKAPDGALESILAGWAARKRHRRVRNVALASVLSAAAAIVVFALMPSGEKQAVSAEYVAETKEATHESLLGGSAAAPSHGPAAAATFRQSPDAPTEISEPSLPGTSVADTASSVAAPDSKTPASETPASETPDKTTSAMDDIAAANRYLASLADSKPKRKRLNLSFAANSGLMDNVAGSPVIVTSVIVTPIKDPFIDGLSYGNASEKQQIFEMRQIEEKTHYVFSAPVSAAISLSYDLTDRLALESGFCYTSFSSRLAMPSRPDTYSHRFIGIPLALRYSFVDGQRVSLYLKAGAMAEKCMDDSSVLFSASGAAGINYKLNDWLGIFAEPYLSYHFDTPGIASTIYDTAPLQPGLQAGLRLTL